MDSVICVDTIDISPCFDPEVPLSVLQHIAARISRQFEDLGFLYITIPERSFHCPDTNIIIRNAFHCAEEYFHQPEDIKCTGLSKDRAKRGYAPMASENFGCLNGEQKPNDLVEKFRIGPFIQEMSDYYRSKAARAHFFENSWPTAPPSMQEHCHNYYICMDDVMHALARLFEIALNLSEGFITSRLTQHTSILSLNHYPPMDNSTLISGDSLRIAEHSDVSVFTIVCQSMGDPGLQVQARGGGWVSLLPQEHTFLVNVGDCLMDWTNGYWRSTKHRVVFPETIFSSRTASRMDEDNTKGADASHESFVAAPGHRYSLVFFVGLNYDATMDPILCGETIVEDTNDRTEPVLTYNEWRKKRVQRAMNQLKFHK